MEDSSDGKSPGKRKIENSDESEKSSKRTRSIWTPEISKSFVEAISSLGIENATPIKITELMNIEGLTHEIVATHFHKFMRNLRRIQDFASKNPTSGEPLSVHQHQVFYKMSANLESSIKGRSLLLGKFAMNIKRWKARALANAGKSSEKQPLEVHPLHYWHAHRKSTLEKFQKKKTPPKSRGLMGCEISGAHQMFDKMSERSEESSSEQSSSSSFTQQQEDVHVQGVSSSSQFDDKDFLFVKRKVYDFLHYGVKKSSNVYGRPLFYCVLFPLHYELHKDEVVQFWIALGFFFKEPMEIYAGLYFDKCVTQGYFEFCRTNLVTGKPMYKLKVDTFESILLLISTSSHIVRIEDDSGLNDASPEASHVSISCCDLKDISFIQRFKQLRTLIFHQGHELNFKQVSRDFFASLRHLRVLDLSKTLLMELPSSVGNMKCLYYLDLSHTPIKRLPETVDCLVNLQTLKLEGCSNLFVLPKGMRKLVNLRHLNFDVFRQLRSMPMGMGNLTKIRTLPAFLVGVEEGCCIRQLKNMDNLCGSFCISRLENVLTKNDAEEAFLSNKSKIKKLELHWSDSGDEDVSMHGKVLSSLQPSASLEVLHINCYGGFELPSWVSDLTFSKLVTITLFEFENCLALSPLGQLPSLKILNIVNFYNLKVIDHNLYGGLGIPGYIAFPKLEKLTVKSMFSLEEWSGLSSFDFPSLVKLTVKHCPNLHRMCTLSSLCSLEILEISHCEVLAPCPNGKLPSQIETLIIEDCPLISTRFLNEGDQDWCKIAHIPHVWIDHEEKSFG